MKRKRKNFGDMKQSIDDINIVKKDNMDLNELM